MPSLIEPGVYRHFKGNYYEVIGTASLVDTETVLVIYRPLYGAGDLVAREFKEFTGRLVRDGVDHKRFTFIGPPGTPYGDKG